MTELTRRTAMFSRAPVANQDLAVDAAAQARLADLRLDGVIPDPGNPRRHFDQAALELLAESLKANGLIQPVVVRPGEGGTHILIAGERRWRAAQIAGFVSIKAIIRPNPKDEVKLLLAQIAENEAREPLSTIELIDAVGRLSVLGMAKKDIATRLGMDASRVARIAGLADLPSELAPLVDTLAVEPLYELLQHFKRDPQAVLALLRVDAAPSRATIRALGSGDRTGSPTPAPGDSTASEPVVPLPSKSGVVDTVGPIRSPHCAGGVTITVRHADYGEGRVVAAADPIRDRLPIQYHGSDAVIQTLLSELAIVAVD